MRSAGLLFCALFLGACARLQPNYDRYLEPARLVEIAPERQLNLRCEGSGGPTILLEAGLGFPSLSWRDVQPGLAHLARTCAYDRAGLGFSNAGPLPRSAAAIVDDLELLIDRAGLEPPFVLVGNSMGGQIVRLFAFRHSEHAENNGCIAGPAPGFSKELVELLRQQRMQPAWYEAAHSESLMLDTDNETQLKAARRHLGDIPIIVLSASRNFQSTRSTDTRIALLAEQERLLGSLATLSNCGELRLVDSGHVIQTGALGAVVDAVQDVLAGRCR